MVGWEDEEQAVVLVVGGDGRGVWPVHCSSWDFLDSARKLMTLLRSQMRLLAERSSGEGWGRERLSVDAETLPWSSMGMPPALHRGRS